jgi:hypothetical protein
MDNYLIERKKKLKIVSLTSLKSEESKISSGELCKDCLIQVSHLIFLPTHEKNANARTICINNKKSITSFY